MAEPSSSWVTLVVETFPHWRTFPEDCAIPLGIDVNQWDHGEAIDAVGRGGGRPAFLRRLLLTHPIGRPHHEQFDGRFWNAFTEAEAFAWAQDVAALGSVEFVETEGAPDLKAGEFWVEAKTVEESESERQETQRLMKGSGGMLFRGPRRLASPDEGLVAKFDRQANDAVKKWRRQNSGRLITFFDLHTVDFGISRDQALADVANWAEQRARTDSTSIVICFNHQWRTPFVVEGLR